MQTSGLAKLQGVVKIVLAAGHGGGDTGAVHGQFKEADQTIVMADEIVKALQTAGLAVDLIPHRFGLKESIDYVNDRYKANEAWAIEIHRDSAAGLPPAQASFRCGIYHYPSAGSGEVAAFVSQALQRAGADGTTWARPDTASPVKGGLAWIRETKPLAHLIHLGFMQGDNSEGHLRELATMAAHAIYEAFTGRPWGVEAPPAPPRPKPPEPKPSDAKPPAPTASTALEALVTAYKNEDLAAVFRRLKAEVSPDHVDTLRAASLAQWILESGWGKSELARVHHNFGGLKYRTEMAQWTEEKDGVTVQPVKYTAWDGPDTYCKFSSPSAYIKGYWRFLMRAPYAGWAARAGSCRDYISHLLECGYTVNDKYLGEVSSLLPKAEALLAGAVLLPGPAPEPVATAAAASAISRPSGKNRLGQIDDSHWLTGAKREPIPGGNPMHPLLAVIHYTEGFSGAGSVSGWKSKNNGVLAHVVIDRDGTIHQCRPFNKTCGHAGGPGMSRWHDPRTGKLHDGVNSCSIGIEIANTGMNTAYHAKLGSSKTYPAGQTVRARHRNGPHGSDEARNAGVWEEYPEAQLGVVFDLVALLMQTYGLHDITGHDCIAPERKADPGPAFPMRELREANGFTGLPTVWGKQGKRLC